jgi:hypothetical protein
MPDPNELKRIEATHGRYRGSVLDVPAAEADQAIADGWARDPHAVPDPNAGQPEFDQDKHDKAEAAAEAWANKRAASDIAEKGPAEVEADPAEAEDDSGDDRPSRKASPTSSRSRRK